MERRRGEGGGWCGSTPLPPWTPCTLTIRLCLALAPSSLGRYVKLGTCTSVLQVWLGMGPMQIAMTATVVVEALLFMPASPDEGGEATKLHDSLQKFGW